MKPRSTYLLAALWRRQVSGRLALQCVVAAALGVYAAALAVELRLGGAAGAGALLLDRLVLGFDVTAMGAMVFLTNLRMAVTTAEDHHAAWLDPWVAQGGARYAYLPSLAFTAALAGLLVATAAAGAYGVGLLYLDGAAEILGRLPRIVAAGAVVLAAHALFSGLVGMVLRNTPATVALVGAFTVAPAVLLTSWMGAHPGADPPRWLHALSFGGPPPLYLPAGWKTFLFVAVWSAAVLTLSVPAAARFVGRRP